MLLLAGGYIAVVEARRRKTGGRGLLFRSQAGLAWVFRIFVDSEYADLPFPVQLRRRLEELGPTYVKLGQILSLRSDILPSSVTQELQNLLSRLPEVDFEEILLIIESDLGRPLAEMFAEVDEKPLASASIAQTHKAVTLNGERVILKVVKPGIRELLIRDAALLRIFGRILQWITPQYQPRRVADEFCEFTLREIEMQLEAENTENFIENFKDMPEVVFPEIYREYTGERVLCEEFLDGVAPDSDLASSLSESERQQLIDVGASAIIRMLYEDGFFHADLHPGNMMVLPGMKIGFIDLGMVGRIESDVRHHLFSTYYGMVMGNFDQAARHLAEVAQKDEKSDVPGFRRAMRELCRRWRRGSTSEQKSLALLMLESVQLGARYHMYYPVEMVLMVKALITYEGVGYMMNPNFDVAEVSERHVYRIFRTQLSPASLIQQGLRAAPDMVDALVRMPQLVSEGLRILEQQTQRPPEKPLAGLRGTLFGGFALVSGAILAAFDGPWPVWSLLIILGLLVPLRRGR
ncbi:MAG: AarF/ABC1/UbiB kinase family protein [Acidobacteria bacterium]|nr:AarF/ABC1/UbiB kinase family protein [Acidobacteriota bacterium]